MDPNSSTTVDRLVIISVSERQGDDLMKALVSEHFYFTKVDSSGLVFQEANICLLIGLNQRLLEPLMALIEQYCHPYEEFIPLQPNPQFGLPPVSMIEARTGGALVYTMDVERFVQF